MEGLYLKMTICEQNQFKTQAYKANLFRTVLFDVIENCHFIGETFFYQLDT